MGNDTGRPIGIAVFFDCTVGIVQAAWEVTKGGD